MGVKNLKKFIRERYPNEIQKMNLSDFYGKVFMMDIMSYIYKFKVSMQERWLQSVINLIKIFKSKNVHVNIVFEGESPIEKTKEREQRREQRKKQEQKINDIKLDILKYHQTGFISNLLKEVIEKINKTDTEKINRLLHYNSNVSTSTEIVSINYKTLESIEEYIEKKENQLVVVTEQDANKIKDICDVFSVPYFQSGNEAETLCCRMCLNVKDGKKMFEISNNIPIGVISEDTDVLAYGANMLLCDLNISNGECNVIYLPSLLKTMEFSYHQFLDFCILSGTDYNNNIPGLGSVKCFELLKKYNSINDIYKNEEKQIEKKINDAIKKNMKNKLNNKDIIEENNKETIEENNKDIMEENNKDIMEEENITDDLTIEKLYKDMKRATEMFDLIEKSDNKTKYWDTNINYDEVCELFLKYNIDSYSIEKLWINDIKFIR
jgi:flap endonuclease-1